MEEKEIIQSFAEIAKGLGYSEAHGKILGALILSEKPLSLQELAKKTGYSISTISVASDFLELFGLVKKVKKPGDRRIYLELSGDLLEGLRKAILFKIKSGIAKAREKLKDAPASVAQRLEKELDRIEKYIDALAAVPIPKS